MNSDLKNNFEKFDKEFREYCESKRATIKLLAVSKTKSLSQIIELYHFGQKSFGENYAQELRDKNLENLSDTSVQLDWHFIGQIQKNKIKYIVGVASIIHTVDSYEKAALIDALCEDKKIKQKILLQINVSGDKKKAGINPSEAEVLVKKIRNLKQTILEGFMTITEFSKNPEDSREFYRDLKSLAFNLEKEFVNPPELSMGMSNDYKVAIDEGATIIRIGTKIFGEEKKEQYN